jgi:hypothetical protein
MQQFFTIVGAGLVIALVLSAFKNNGDTIVSQRFDNSIDRLIVTFKSGRVLHVDVDGGVIDFDSLTA